MPQWVLAFFGALRAGAVAVPLDVRSAPDFVARVLESTEPRLAFASRLTRQSMNGETPLVMLEGLDQAVASSSPDPTEHLLERGRGGPYLSSQGTEREGPKLTLQADEEAHVRGLMPRFRRQGVVT